MHLLPQESQLRFDQLNSELHAIVQAHLGSLESDSPGRFVALGRGTAAEGRHRDKHCNTQAARPGGCMDEQALRLELQSTEDDQRTAEEERSLLAEQEHSPL